MYTQLNQYHVILEAQAAVPTRSQQAEPYLRAVECFVRRDGCGSVYLVGAEDYVGGSNTLTNAAAYTPSASTLTPPVNAILRATTSTLLAASPQQDDFVHA